MHRLGKGYKIISKCLDIPVSTVGSIIRKWKLHHTTQALPRKGRPSKLSAQTRRRLVREATERPTITLKELQSSVAGSGVMVHQSTISRALHNTGLYGRVARKKPLLKKYHLKARLEFARKHESDCDKDRMSLSVRSPSRPVRARYTRNRVPLMKWHDNLFRRVDGSRSVRKGAEPWHPSSVTQTVSGVASEDWRSGCAR